MQGLIANGRSDTPGVARVQASPSGKPATSGFDREAAAVAGPAVFGEWLAAHRIEPAGPAERLAAVAAFMALQPRLGWAGNLRRRTSRRLAIRRGAASWTFHQLSASDADWREAAGPHADGGYEDLVRVVADHLLCADTRPDDTLVWRGDAADPWPFGALAFGASLVLPAVSAGQVVTPPVPGRGGR